jgi:WD40 repeat protein
MMSRVDGIRVHEAQTGRELFQQPGAPDLLAYSASADGETIAVATPASVQVFGAVDGNRRRVLEWPKTELLELSFDGSLIAARREDQSVAVFDAQSGNHVARLEASSGVARVAFSMDNRYVLTASKDRVLMLSFADNGKEVWRLSNMDVWRVSFAHDDRTIAVIDQNQGVKIIETATGATVASIPLSGGAPPVAAAFASDGSHVDIADERSVTRHALDREALVEQVCSVLTRNIPRTEWITLAPGVPYRPVCTNLPQP